MIITQLPSYWKKNYDLIAFKIDTFFVNIKCVAHFVSESQIVGPGNFPNLPNSHVSGF